MYHKNRGNRRYQTYLKSKRKENIVHNLNNYWHYKHFGQYRKGKIHCSCAMCSAKTNTNINKSNGPVCNIITYTNRLSVTNHRKGKKNYKISDIKKLEKLDYEDEINMTNRDLAIKAAMYANENWIRDYTEQELYNLYDEGFIDFIPNIHTLDELGRIAIDDFGGFIALPIEEFEYYQTNTGEFDYATWAKEVIVEQECGGVFTPYGYIAIV